MGDASDNIPGCPGVGEKTAAKLIAQFGSIEQLVERTNELKGALRQKVENHREKIIFSKYLATIRTDAPVSTPLESLRRSEPATELLKKLFTELEFRSLIQKLSGSTTATPKGPFQPSLFDAEPTESTEEISEPNLETFSSHPHNYTLVENEDDMRSLCANLLTKKIISLDTETTSTDPQTAKLVGMSFAATEFEAYYVPVPQDYDAAKFIVTLFKPLYESTEILKVGQNLKYDFTVLSHNGIN